jgi:16S rRNA (cytosine967-C5)-methyltransferase
MPALINAMQTRPPIWLRVSQKNTSIDAFSRELTRQSIEFSRGQEQDQGLILAKGRDITTLPGFKQGWFAVQDGAAQLAAQYLATQPQERVLDCCAAPGGKTCHIIESQPLLSECVALDVDSARLSKVEENLTRLGLAATLIRGDASQPSKWWDGQQFDRILLDAPCSATGIIRRHPDIKWLRKSADIKVLVELQKLILNSMWALLKPGGTMLYATCSILPEENTQQISQFLAETKEAQLLPLSLNETIENPGRQILPGEGQMDGFYYARLLKSTDKQ